jgi:hypothetical protein
MIKSALLGFVVFAVVFSLQTNASAGLLGGGASDLEVTLTCPNTVKAGSLLNVKAVIKNNNCTSAVVFSRTYAGMTGNPGTTLSGYGIWGPVVRTLSAQVAILKATCNEYGDVVTPGIKTLTSVRVIDTVPGTLAGKLADVYWGGISAGGKTETQGVCVVEVIP